MKKALFFITGMLLVVALCGCSKKTPPPIEIVEPFSNYDFTAEIPIDGESDQKKGFLVKQKKSSYQGNDVMILHVKNQSEKNYSISIEASYLDGNGDVIKTETKNFDGFAAGYENFFLFQPEIHFESFSFELKTEVFDGIPVAQYLLTSGTNGDRVRLELTRSKMNMENTEEFDDWYTVTTAYFNVANTYDKTLSYSADFVLLDSSGEIYIINSKLKEKSLRPIKEDEDVRAFGHTIYLDYTDVLWKDKDSYVWPDRLSGEVVGFVAVNEVKE